ncbi:hypothetical protein ABT093_17300 [Kitasatospora sp. NPDC002551]|uniref:hypothetical protein n=1 Tax=Kitasatospora sp. NPDC002551 TaxID=3154539 RepID=UPI00332F7739
MSTETIGDLLLRWLSERQGGSVTALREGVRSTAQAYGIGTTEYSDWDWVRDLSSLGFLDADFRTDRWSAAPLVLTRLPFSDGLALITGARPAAVRRALDSASADWLELLEIPGETRQGAVPLPATLMVQYDDAARLGELAARLGAAYVPCAALQLGALLPRAQAEAEAAPPGGAGLDTVERYDLTARRFVPAGSHSEDGLYRWRGADHTLLVRLLRGGRFTRTERETGIYLELARHNDNAMRWRPETGAGRTRLGRLFVDRNTPLPPLHARAAVLCTGLPPIRGNQGQTLAYDNVPLVLAEALAASLLQDLQILPPLAAVPGRAT